MASTTKYGMFVESPEFQDSLYRNIPVLFRDMGFVENRRAGRWESPYKMHGGESHDKRREKTVISQKYVPLQVFEQGEKPQRVLDFYAERNGLTWREAVERVAGILGLPVPKSFDGAEYRKWEEKQDRLEAIVRDAAAALRSPQGAEALKYLKAPRSEGGRGYTDEVIEEADLGFFTAELAERYRAECGGGVSFHPNVGKSPFYFSIPDRSGGRVTEFDFRAVKEGVSPRYINIPLSESDTKKSHFFGITGLRVSDREGRNITVVEGQLDASLCKVAGLRNVCACSGSSTVTPEALRDAKARGVDSVTLLFDTEETAEKRDSTEGKVEAAVRTVMEAGLVSRVCFIPSKDGVKTDPDSFLTTPTGEEGETAETLLETNGRKLKSLIDGAEFGGAFLFRRALMRHSVTEGEGEERRTRVKDINGFTREVVRIYNTEGISIEERGMIRAEYTRATGGAITEDMLIKEAERERAEARQRKQDEAAAALMAEAQAVRAKEGTEAMLRLLERRAAELKGVSRETYFEEKSRPQTVEDIDEERRRKKPGLPTQYIFVAPGGTGGERLTLPCGALTFVGAQTSHGKSRMLQNLALWEATHTRDMREVKPGEKWDEGKVLYFSFEEDRVAVQYEFLNIHANMHTSTNNLKSINSYFSAGQEYFDFQGKGSGLKGLEERDAEVKSLFTSGRLWVFYEPNTDSGELIEYLNFLRERHEIKAVFIDYVQRLRKRGSDLLRKEELRVICEDLMQFSVETGLPVILAAQLNREAKSPIDMAVQNMADASDIEQSANIVMLLWNSAVEPLQNNTYFIGKKGDKLSKRAASLEGQGAAQRENPDCDGDYLGKLWEKGFHIGEPGFMYAILAKNRGGTRGSYARLRFNGNTGKILPEYGVTDFMEETRKKRRPAPESDFKQMAFYDEDEEL